MKFRILPVVCGVAAASFASCAQPESPRGGEPDRSPPYVRETLPATMAVVDAWDGPVVIRFNERISQRGVEQAVTVSPETGEVEVDKGRSELRISIKGGWRKGQIYRIVVHPVVQDLFGNKREEAFDLIFSTGPPIPNTALAGLLTDRITAKPVQDARVEAVRRADSVTYVATTDTAGFYALRHIPAGAYDLRAYLDRNRNRQVDFGEAVDSSAAVLSVSDTVVVSFELLPGDTTASNLLRAEALDSLQVRMHFDDYMDPEAMPLEGIAVELIQLPDSTPVEVAEVLWPHEADRRVAEQRAVQDSLAALESSDSLAAGAATGTPVEEKAAVDSTGMMPDLEADLDAAPADTAPPLPVRELVVVPAKALPPETEFSLTVRGIQNINGLTGGGGSVEFRTPAAPAEPEVTDSIPADAPPADSMSSGSAPIDTPPTDALPADTVRADTMRADTMRADTVRADTMRADTSRMNPATSSQRSDPRQAPGPISTVLRPRKSTSIP